MGKIRDLTNRLEAATEEAQTEALSKIIKDSSHLVVDLNIDQMLHGRNNEGEILGDYARSTYQELKQKMNPQAQGHVDLRLSGDFQDAMYLEGDTFPFNVNSKDSKTGKLADGYDGIFGLDETNKTSFVEEIRDKIREYYKRIFSV